jgi:hypothetical protein
MQKPFSLEEKRKMKKNLILVLFLAGFVLFAGVDQGLFAQTQSSDGSTLQTSGKIKSGAPPEKKFQLSKRNLMMIEQAESARMRAEKILAAPQGSAEMPKK